VIDRPLPVQIVQQLAQIALAHTPVVTASSSTSGVVGSGTAPAKKSASQHSHLEIDASGTTALRDDMESTMYRQLNHAIAVTEHCRFRTGNVIFSSSFSFFSSFVCCTHTTDVM
jgi:hypothetical protein